MTKSARKMKLWVICVVVISGALPLFAQSASSSQSTSQATTSSSPPATTTTAIVTESTTTKTTLSPEDECAQYNNSCKDCVKHSKCLYCNENDKCLVYPKGDILPKSSLCPLSDARWGVCWVNFEALIISCGVIGGVIILAITICLVYCCCCRGRSKKRYAREDSRYEQQKMERKVKQDERRTERKSRLDEIRRKYGLVKDDAPYQRFDA